MADTQKYIAIADGYYDGRVIKAGEAFVADFREIVRDEDANALVPPKKSPEGKPITNGVYPIKRDKDGNAVRGKIKVPTWAEPADAKEFAAAMAADTLVTDPNLEAMALPGLQAYAAERGVPFEGLKKADLITAIKAANDFTR